MLSLRFLCVLRFSVDSSQPHPPDESLNPPHARYVVFKIVVTSPKASWVIFRRFSQLYDLYKKLKMKGLTDYVRDPTFPPKEAKSSQSVEPQHIEDRRFVLERWLNSVMARIDARSALESYNFLGPFQLKDEKGSFYDDQ